MSQWYEHNSVPYLSYYTFLRRVYGMAAQEAWRRAKPLRATPSYAETRHLGGFPLPLPESA